MFVSARSGEAEAEFHALANPFGSVAASFQGLKKALGEGGLTGHRIQHRALGNPQSRGAVIGKSDTQRGSGGQGDWTLQAEDRGLSLAG